MRVHVTSDGLPGNTHVTTEDGHEIEHIERISWDIDAGGLARLRIHLNRHGLDASAELLCPTCGGPQSASLALVEAVREVLDEWRYKAPEQKPRDVVLILAKLQQVAQ